MGHGYTSRARAMQVLAAVTIQRKRRAIMERTEKAESAATLKVGMDAETAGLKVVNNVKRFLARAQANRLRAKAEAKVRKQQEDKERMEEVQKYI